MTLLLNGTNGVSDVDGSASTPAIRGTDTNTGIFFPAADTIAFAEGGAEVARFDSSGNLGIGTTTPAGRLEVNSSGTPKTITSFSTSNFNALGCGGSGGSLAYGTGTFFTFCNQPFADRGTDNNLTERMRIDSSGNLLLNTTSVITSSSFLNIKGVANARSCAALAVGANGNGAVDFFNASNGYAGSIVVNASSVSYNTSSDYRLKDNIAPITGALATVSALKPVTYKWKVDGSDGQGFIAHELQAVVPDCVSGEKDAVDAEGNPVYQGIDTSFLVATLTAAIQEQQAIITDLKSRIEALEQA